MFYPLNFLSWFTAGPEDGSRPFIHRSKQHALHLKTYFCDTHALWQEGSIEQAIGRMRRLLRTKTDLPSLTDEQLNILIAIYNNAPLVALTLRKPCRSVLESTLAH